jgi:hypothetical protein
MNIENEKRIKNSSFNQVVQIDCHCLFYSLDSLMIVITSIPNIINK